MNELIKQIEELENELEMLREDNQKLRNQIQVFKAKTTWRVYEENFRLALELALLKGEMSG
ncbi:hypothetical protein LRS37_04520 [Neobacillus sedimentimangrovi]|uniref:Uncharacterized protein n=1 Tax=Neobacillus sedimentimangrovi TaxID=2699460 RepID=A0ABS8QFY2_9BACI|nr:hypothetical protein [Neobacillus sedimentimangrovi]MCD4838145.1 hypothetical protein [Neobacillus sedimentimangrovi]